MAQIKKPKTIEIAGESAKGEYWKVTWADDKTNIIFDSEQKATIEQAIEQDTQIEYTVKKDGKYFNVTSVKIAEAESEPPAKELRSAYGQDSPEKRRSIERQSAAQIAFEFGINTIPNGIWTVHEALRYAEAIYQWIVDGTIPPEPSKPALKAPPSPVKEEVKGKVSGDVALTLQERLNTDEKRSKALAKLNEYAGGAFVSVREAFNSLKREQKEDFLKWLEKLGGERINA